MKSSKRRKLDRLSYRWTRLPVQLPDKILSGSQMAAILKILKYFR